MGTMRHHAQDLLKDDSKVRKSYVFHRRGWLKRVRFFPYPGPRSGYQEIEAADWEISIRRRPEATFHATVTLGGEDSREVALHLEIAGASLFVSVHHVLPERWAIGWFKRGEVQNPRWSEDSHGRTTGIYLFERAISLQFMKTQSCSGPRSEWRKYGWDRYFYLPWDMGSNVRHEVMQPGGKMVPAAGWSIGETKSEEERDGRQIFEAPYTYTRDNGEVQHRKAKFHVEEREWRWRCTHRLPFRIGPKIVHRSIVVAFDGEVGERTGTWKGGTVGCGYEMLPGELPIETLRRMERERKF